MSLLRGSLSCNSRELSPSSLHRRRFWPHPRYTATVTSQGDQAVHRHYPGMVTFHRVPVMTGTEDREGCLLFANGSLVAVIVRLDTREYTDTNRKWFLEAGVGRCRERHELFDSIEDAANWVRERCRVRVRPPRPSPTGAESDGDTLRLLTLVNVQKARQSN